jgi:hypothetical protein
VQTEVSKLLLWIACIIFLYKIYFDKALKILHQNVAGANEQSIYSQLSMLLCITGQTEVNKLLLWIACIVLLYKIYFYEALKLLNQNVAGANEQTSYPWQSVVYA